MTDPALDRYRRRVGRQRLVYFSVVGVIVLALATVAAIAWSHGEIAHTTLHTVPQAPADLAPSTPSTTQTLAWRTGDAAATGDPHWRGTVVVYGGHTVRGVNARTGAQTWSYTRSDRTVCDVAQVDGTAVAFYDLAGNCDEVTALDAGTGVRQWTRTLDEDGHPLFGRPQIQAVSSPVDAVVVTTASVIYTLQPDNGGQDDFLYARYGCAIQHAVLGTAGLLVSQNCSARVQCGQLKFCGKGPQLFLRSDVSNDGQDTKSDTNPDRITWNRLGDSDRPVSADGVLSAYDASGGALDLLGAMKGAPAGRVALARGTTLRAGDPVVAYPTTDNGPEIIGLGAHAYAVSTGDSEPDWTAATLGPPTVVPPSGAVSADLDRVQVVVPAPGGVQELGASSGSVQHTYRVARPATGATVHPLGAGFLVAAGDGTLAYR